MKHLYKLAFILVIGTGLALAQTTPSTSPSGAQTPDNSQMGQKGAGSANAVSDIQAALHKQLPNVADNVTVSTTDDNKVQLSGTVSSDAEKQQVEQIARTAAPNADITNKLTVGGSTAPGNEPSSQPPASKPPKVQLIAYQAGSASQTPSSQTSPSSQTPSSQTSPSSQTPSSQTPSSQTPSSPSSEPAGSMSQTPAAGSSDVQDKIQKAIQQDSSLSGANVNVSVTGDKVELTGTVASKDQKKTVKQIADSNAGGMKVVDHVKVEKGANANPTSAPPQTPKN